MTENVFTPQAEPQAEPKLRRNIALPKGVLQKNLKTLVYLGAVSLVIVAALFSSSGKKTPAQQVAAAAFSPTGVAVPCVPGRPCAQMQQGSLPAQLTPEQQQAQLIAA